ncbi:hypothetical protein Si110_00729 [Streptococcus infantarius subsp. infantarius]|nr:hypothetical protein [Streptococcus infantarius subsp. infantarius]MCO4513648.1 hypothetical protein [Streptococcus infantarius subsp. infantarius]MCO4515483.1 hypothetical protein [Streptococcus infantarius subsp. infantarius]
MRVPKFRAWDVHEKKMFTNAQLIVWNGNVYANDNSELNADKLKGWSIDEKYLMQSTGLADENGKEIFEGDIVKFSDCDDDVYVTPVVWDKNYACFGVSFTGKYPISFDYLEEFYTELKDIEVVGNIYENPELLEGE